MEMVLGALIAFAVEVLVVALLLGWKPIRRSRTPHGTSLRNRIAVAAERWRFRPPRLTG